MTGGVLRALMFEVDELEKLLGCEDGDTWCNYIRSIHGVYSTMVQKNLAEDFSYEKKFEDFNDCFNAVHDGWGLPETLKVHLMNSHVLEFLAAEGCTMWSMSEECMENCHNLFKVLARKGGYENRINHDSDHRGKQLQGSQANWNTRAKRVWEEVE